MSEALHAGPGTGAEFPRTPVSRLVRLREGDDRRRQHLEKLCELYWRPVYAFIRRMGSADREKAQDLTQDFFAWAFESELLLKFDPACGNFRSFLKAVLRNFVREDHRRASADKRGGRVRFVSADSAGEAADVPADLVPDDAFDRQWVRDVLAQAVAQLERDLKAQGRETWFRALRLYDLEERPATYGEIAAQLGLAESDVRNYLHRARTRLREIVMSLLGEYIGRDDDVLAEMREILRI